ncbi:molybdopterin-dependent oxidoreductase [Sporichthya brevicatena]|uniref:Molybdopterin-dependent oxidoreductase n=1 Tax=Sporichthya brevicatena TaxID=171442 RepID=A0ABN1G9Y8_9ACTN
MVTSLRSRVAAANTWVADRPPPGPFRAGFWRSPIRGPWLTSVLGAVLLVGLPVMFATGLLSYLAYNPWLPGNDGRHASGVLTFVPFHWPASPAWGYRVTQGLHVTLGVVLVPVILAKLWSVIPKLFVWPPVASPAQALERLSLFLLVGGAMLTFATGLLNIQYWYRFPGSFYVLHFYAAWVFVVSAAAHVALKIPTMRAALRERRVRDELRTPLAGTTPEPYTPNGLVSARPAAPTISRRGALGLVGAGSLTAFVMVAPQTVGGPVSRLGLLSPRGGYDPGGGPNDFGVNTTAGEARITPALVGGLWRLEIAGGPSPIVLSRADLAAMEQHEATLAIACVEGWSSGNQRWRGVRLRDLATLSGVADPASVHVESLQDGGAFGRGRLAGNQIAAGDSLLALQVNDADLSLDHGFPARIIVPNNPGVRNTKWVKRLTFET